MTSTPDPRLPGRMVSSLASAGKGTRGFDQRVAIERARQTVHRGRELLDQGKNEEAADLLRTIRAGLDLVGKDAGDEPRRLEALASSLLGQAISTRGDDRDAQHAFTYAIAIYEGLQELTAEEWAAFAAALHGVGKLDQAIDAQRMAVDDGEALQLPGFVWRSCSARRTG